MVLVECCMTDNAKKILDDLVSDVTGDKLVSFIRGKLFSDDVNIPCKKWSVLNQFIAYMRGTGDARGYKQWQEAGRQVKKGAKAIYILVPMIYKVKNEKEEKEEDHRLTGFKAMPVFRVEDTEGQELDYVEKLKTFQPDSLPLLDVAKKLNIEVIAGLTGNAGGWFYPGTNTITMGSNDGQVFLHELAHAVDQQIEGKSDEYSFNEIVAELTAALLASLYGVSYSKDNSIAYIRGWSKRSHVAHKLVQAMERVEKIYNYIADIKENEIQAA